MFGWWLIILKKIELHNFRNYDKFSLNFFNNINIIYGKNGLGKTNIIEAIHFLLLSKSHRISEDSFLINKNSDFFVLKGEIENSNITNFIEVRYLKKAKEFFFNNNKIKKYKELKEILKVIIFYPEDLELIKGSSIERRNYLNIQLSQIYPMYSKQLKNYEKLLFQRNIILKNINLGKSVDYILFNTITDKLIQISLILYKYRKNYIDNINININDIYFDLTGENDFKINYHFFGFNSNDNTENLEFLLKNEYIKNSNLEIEKATTLYGAHKDEIVFSLKNENLRFFGSQGQQRIAVIALKLSEIAIFKVLTGKYPILLLDDIFSELDSLKIENIINYLEKNIQTIITTTDIENLSQKLKEKSNLINLEKEVQNVK